MNFFKKAFNATKKIRSNSLSAGEQITNVAKKFLLSKMKFIILGPFLIPALCLLIVFIVIVSMFGEKINLLQLVDSGSGSSSYVAGKGIYSEADFEDAYSLAFSLPIINGCDFSDFDSKLSSTPYKNTAGFNNFIKENVKKAGFGTREGVVAAAMSLAYEYPKATNYKYFYTYTGSRCSCGVDQMRHGAAGIVDGVTYLDCRAFVQWALYNGGYDAEILRYIDGASEAGTPISDVTKVQPGDIFSTNGEGHIWMVVGLYDGGYYSAEELGCGNGAVVNKYSWDNAYGSYPSATAYDMSNYYNNPANVRPE